MRTPPILLALALAMLLLATLPAEAHVETFSETATMDVGRYSALIDPRPAPLFQGASLSFTAILTDKTTGRMATDVTAVLNVTAPSGATKSTTLRPDQTGYLVGALILNESGNHTARLTVSGPDGTSEGTTWLDVYPNLPWRIVPGDATFDPYAGVRSTLEFQVINATTYQGDGTLDDLTMRLEHWTDDHGTLVRADEVPLTHAGGGLWRAEYTFPTTGMYHMRFASEAGSFTYDDVPLLHMYATEPPADAGRNETPGPLAAAALLALAGVALALARRT